MSSSSGAKSICGTDSLTDTPDPENQLTRRRPLWCALPRHLPGGLCQCQLQRHHAVARSHGPHAGLVDGQPHVVLQEVAAAAGPPVWPRHVERMIDRAASLTVLQPRERGKCNRSRCMHWVSLRVGWAGQGPKQSACCVADSVTQRTDGRSTLEDAENERSMLSD